MNFRCKFRRFRSIRRPTFHVRVQNFSDLPTFSVDFCILYAECPPYFYFRGVWPTDLESIPHASTPASIITTRFEVDMTINCRDIAFLSADTSRDLVTLTFALLTLNRCHTWRVRWRTLTSSMQTLSLSVLELWVIKFPVGYQWECVSGHCACAESRDPWVGGQKQLHFWNPRPRFAYLLCNFGGSAMKVITVTVLDFKGWAYNRIYGDIQQHLYCACAETVIYEIRCKYRHRCSIRRPRFPITVQNFGDLATFFVVFLHFVCWMSAIFLLAACLTHWPCIPPGWLNRVPASAGVRAGISPLSGGR